MYDVRLFLGQVIDSNDPDKKARAKVRILPEMQDAQEDALPWLRPFLQSGLSKEEFSLDLPSDGDMVWCLFIDEYLLQGFYISGAFMDGMFDFDKVKQSLGDISEASGSFEYPDLRFSRYPDGTITFHNRSDGTTGLYHSSGTYIVTTKDGKVVVKSVKSVKLYNDNGSLELKDNGNIDLVSGTTKIEMSSSDIKLAGSTDYLVTFTTLKSILQTLASTLDSHPNVDPISGVTGPSSAPISATIGPLLDQIKATKLKTT